MPSTEITMFSHVTVGSQDLPRSRRFYAPLTHALGYQRREARPDGGPDALCGSCSAPGAEGRPRVHVQAPYDGRPASAGNRGRVAVDRAHALGLAAGGRCKGAPALRAPDGKPLHIVTTLAEPLHA